MMQQPVAYKFDSLLSGIIEFEVLRHKRSCPKYLTNRINKDFGIDCKEEEVARLLLPTYSQIRADLTILIRVLNINY